MPKPDGSSIWITVCYEKLPNFCFRCGKIGHDHRICKAERLRSVYKPEEPRYGAWLSTTSCRNWDEAIVIVRNEWPEAAMARRRKEEAIRRSKGPKVEEVCTIDEDELFRIRRNGSCREGNKDEEKDLKTVLQESVVAESDDDTENKVVGRWRRKRPISNANWSGPRLNEVGPSGHKSPPGEVLESEILEQGLPRVSGLWKVVDGQQEVDPNPMAIVPYTGQVLGEIINKMNTLGLKREASEILESGKVKRRKCASDGVLQKSEISAYASSLRKIKTKMRKGGRRKEKGTCDGFVAEVGDEDVVMKENIALVNGNESFVFKASKGRRKRVEAEGEGGWPLTATKAT